MGFIKFNMTNPEEKQYYIEKAFKDIKEICKELQYHSGKSNSEVKTLLREIASLWKTEEKNKFSFR